MKKTKEKTKKKPSHAAKPSRNPGAAPAHATGGGGHMDDPATVASTAQVAADPADALPGLQERVDNLEEALARAKADYQNLQRRSAAQQADAVKYANAELMKSLIAVVDDFDRALAANENAEDPAALAAGMKLVHDNFTKALREHGLEHVPALHEPFDPAVHEALLQRPTDEFEPGTVVEEVAKGYRLRDRVVRPAKVVVSKATDDSASAT